MRSVPVLLPKLPAVTLKTIGLESNELMYETDESVVISILGSELSSKESVEPDAPLIDVFL
jgi:hypothetical protein